MLSREKGAFSSEACTGQGCSFSLPSHGKSYDRIILNTYNEMMRINEICKSNNTWCFTPVDFVNHTDP